MKKILTIIVGVLLLITFSSCEPERVTISARYSTPVYERPTRPYGNYVWIEGDWYVSHGNYYYRRGYWSPPQRYRTWQQGGWVQTNRGYYWRRGRWH